MHKEVEWDYCIVGQGIAGTTLAWSLLKEGCKVFVIDNSFLGASSYLAAGIVNPITGRNYVRSWRVQEFLPVAQKMYIEMAAELGQSLHNDVNMLRCLYTVEDENNWHARTNDELVAHFMMPQADYSEFSGKVVQPLSYGELCGTFQVKMKDIITLFRQKWISEGRYLKASFEYEKLKTESDFFNYENIKFKNIIFCEGHQALKNPFFPNIGLRPSKGEVLFVRIEGAPFTKMYKDGVFIVQYDNDVYWVGGGYENNPIDDQPSEKGYQNLEKELKRILKIDYTILSHKAAIRPTMSNRRPIMQQHQNHPNMYIYNGLGTKGASMAPFFSQQLTRYLLYGLSEDLVIGA